MAAAWPPLVLFGDYHGDILLASVEVEIKEDKILPDDLTIIYTISKNMGWVAPGHA